LIEIGAILLSFDRINVKVKSITGSTNTMCREIVI